MGDGKGGMEDREGEMRDREEGMANREGAWAWDRDRHLRAKRGRVYEGWGW